MNALIERVCCAVAHVSTCSWGHPIYWYFSIVEFANCLDATWLRNLCHIKHAVWWLKMG